MYNFSLNFRAVWETYSQWRKNKLLRVVVHQLICDSVIPEHHARGDCGAGGLHIIPAILQCVFPQHPAREDSGAGGQHVIPGFPANPQCVFTKHPAREDCSAGGQHL
jgi:hypothetical protein